MDYRFDKPETEAWFPTDITRVSEETLGQLLNLYTEWKAYANQQVSITEADLHRKREELRVKEAKALVTVVNDDTLTKFKAKEDRVAYVTQLPAIAELINEVAELTAELKLDKTIAGVFEDRYNCTSRELTRRMSWNK